VPENDKPNTPNMLLDLAKGVFASVDWRKVVLGSDHLMRLIAQPETRKLIAAAGPMRDPIARMLLEDGVITEAEAAPTSNGGLGLIEMIQRLVSLGRIPPQDVEDDGEALLTVLNKEGGNDG